MRYRRTNVTPVNLFKVQVSVGRLVEARVFSLKTPEDVAAYHAEVLAAIQRASRSARAVLIADHRPVRVYSQDVAEHLIEAFKKNNALLERAASVIAADNATMSMQFGRLVREAHYDQRKVFRDVASALEYLQDGLDERERARAAQFLSEWTE